ncbi:hypothetical protein ACVGWV_09250, partial [Enterobacter asburiae]
GVVGGFFLSGFFFTAAGARFHARFEPQTVGLYLPPPQKKKPMTWIFSVFFKHITLTTNAA